MENNDTFIKINKREIWDKLEGLHDKCDSIDLKLRNHLKHHERKERWIMWVVPILLTVLNIFLTFRIGV